MTYPISLITGSTGFVGSKVLSNLEKKVGKVFSLSRKRIDHNVDNIEELIINFDELLKGYDLPNVNHVYLCLGHDLTALNLLNMNEELRKSFYKVDYQYQIAVAEKAVKSGAKSISFISAVGADSNSSNYYFKIKGDVEEKIKDLGYKSVNFFQPGHISNRIKWQRNIQKPRIDVYAADIASFFLDPFMIKGFNKYKSISAEKLSKSIVDKTIQEIEGVNYYHWSDFDK